MRIQPTANPSPRILGTLVAALLSGCSPAPSEGPVEKAVEVFPPRRSIEGVTQQMATPQKDWRRLEEESKREAVALYPELGVEGTAVNREYVRRYKLYRLINPAFFTEPDWPKRLAEILAKDLGLDPRK